jgi:predicted transcriptional regulator
VTALGCEAPMRQRMNVYLPPELVAQVADLAACKKLSQSAIMEAAVTSFCPRPQPIAAKQLSRDVSTG